MLEVIYIWERKYDYKRKIPYHSHDFYELVFYISGSGETGVGSKKYRFRENSFVLIPPNVKHDEEHQGYSSVLVIGFRSIGHDIPLFFSEYDNAAVFELVTNIKREKKSKDAFYEKIIELHVEQIVTLIERELSTTKPKSRNSKIDTAILYMNEYCLTDIDLDELASNAGYCSDRFRNIFKELVGMTPKQYILTKRLVAAKRLLIETHDSLESIAAQVGFNFYSRFSILFKSRTGLSPKEYRTAHRK